MNKYLTPSQIQRIRRKTKQMDIKECCLSKYHSLVSFKHTMVSFEFYPFDYKILICHPNDKFYDFKTREEAEEIKKDMDSALDFVDWLKEFNSGL